MADVCSAVGGHEAQDMEGQHHAVATNVMVANTKKCFLSAGSLNQNGWCKETEDFICVLIHSTSGHKRLTHSDWTRIVPENHASLTKTESCHCSEGRATGSPGGTCHLPPGAHGSVLEHRNACPRQWPTQMSGIKPCTLSFDTLFLSKSIERPPLRIKGSHIMESRMCCMSTQ